MSGGGGAVHQIQQALTIPVNRAERLGPVFLAADDGVVDLPAVDEPYVTVLLQSQAPVVSTVLDEQGGLAILVVGDDVHEAVVVPVRKGGAIAPEEGRSRVARIRGVGQAGIFALAPGFGAGLIGVRVPLDLEELTGSEAGLLWRADVAVPDDAVGLIGQH